MGHILPVCTSTYIICIHQTQGNRTISIKLKSSRNLGTRDATLQYIQPTYMYILREGGVEKKRERAREADNMKEV